MIYPAIQTLAEKLREINDLNVIVGSLRGYNITIPTPAAIIVPIEIKTTRHGNQYYEVTEVYEVAIADTSRQQRPYEALLNLVTSVAAALNKWLPNAWSDNITVKGVTLSSIKFDTHPEADELNLVVASIEVVVEYYAI